MLVAFLLLAHLVASNASSAGARAIVHGMEARYQRTSTLKAIFLERYRQGRSALRVESGTVYFSRPGRMRWEYEAPEKKLFLVEGKRVWFYVPADHTASRASVKEASDWRTPLALLAGKAKLSRLCARVELVERDGQGGLGARPTQPENFLLRCWPRGELERPVEPAGIDSSKQADASGNQIHEVLIEVDLSYRLVRVVIREAGDVEMELRFGDWEENIPLPAALFHFQPPPGVAIVDEASLGNWSH